jgi:hypothetical protein
MPTLYTWNGDTFTVKARMFHKYWLFHKRKCRGAYGKSAICVVAMATALPLFNTKFTFRLLNNSLTKIDFLKYYSQ